MILVQKPAGGTKGAGSRAAGLAMTFKLLEAAEQRWRCVTVKIESEVWRSVACSSPKYYVPRPFLAGAKCDLRIELHFDHLDAAKRNYRDDLGLALAEEDADHYAQFDLRGVFILPRAPGL